MLVVESDTLWKTPSFFDPVWTEFAALFFYFFFLELITSRHVKMLKQFGKGQKVKVFIFKH